MNNKLEIVLKISNKSGVLAGVMLKAGKLGLMIYKNRIEKIDEDSSKLFIAFNGELKCSRNEFIAALESHSQVESVIDIINFTNDSSKVSTSIKSNSNKPISKKETSYSRPEVKLQTIDYISPDAIRIAEEKLVKLLGPVASILIESAQSETRHIGDFFMLLGEELEGEERIEFLSTVEGLDA